MGERTREAWIRPDSTTLVRDELEETVLTGCKVATIGAGLAGGNDQCPGSGQSLCSKSFESSVASWG
jgi:hypothetical protein